MFKDFKEITLEVTNRCNLRCRICSIWKEKKKVDLSLDEIKRILKPLSKPISISLTGGEPFLNPNIDKIYKYLFKLFLQKKIRNIDIATNAYSKRLLNFLETNKAYLLPLSLSISLDGIGKDHNTQRGKVNAFAKTLKNIVAIKKYSVPITLKFVISRINYKSLKKVHALSKKIGCDFNLKFFECVPNYYHRYSECPNLTLTSNEMAIVKKDIKTIFKHPTNEKLTLFSHSSMNGFLKNGNLNFIKTCLTPRHSLFVTSHGEIYSCVYQPKVGDLKYSLNLDWKEYKNIATNAKKGKCPKCLSYHGYLKEFNYR